MSHAECSARDGAGGVGSLRDRQRRFAVAHVERIALTLFAEHGFDRVSVDQIAEASGTSQRTFFRYFPSKDDVVLGYEHRIHERFVAAVRSRPVDEGPVTALRNAYVATSAVDPDDLADVVLRARVVAEAPVLRARAHGERRQSIGEILDVVLGRLGGAIARDPLVRSQTRVVVAAMAAVAQAEWDAWLVDGGVGDPSARISPALELLIAGIGHLDHPTEQEDP